MCLLMPTYSSRCPVCGSTQDYVSTIANRDESPLCCDQQTKRFITSTMVSAMGIADHFKVMSPIDGKPIYGRSEYLAHMNKHGVMHESDVKGEAEHRMKAIKADERVRQRDTVARTIQSIGA